MTRVITVTSGKGGVGKTAITANIGTSLALLGKKVCVIDADFGLRNLEIAVGLTNRVIYDMSDYFQGSCELKQIIYEDKRLANLSFIPGSNDAGLHAQFEQFAEMIEIVAKDYDYVLIDSPSGIDTGFMNAMHVATEAIVVTIPDHTAIQDADRVIGLLEDRFQIDVQLIINMSGRNTDITYAQITDMLHVKVLGIIRHDTEMIRSLHEGIPISLSPEFENGLRFRHIAQNLIDKKANPAIRRPIHVATPKPKMGFFKKLLSK